MKNSPHPWLLRPASVHDRNHCHWRHGQEEGQPDRGKDPHLAVHQKNDKVGQLTGRAMYIVNPVYDDNEAFKKLMSNKFYQNPRYFKDLGMWAVRAPSKELAVMMHAAILASPDLRTTAKRLNPELDVSPMDNPAIKPLEFTLVMSATQFETKEKGLFPPSLVRWARTRTTSRTSQEQVPQRRLRGPRLPRPGGPEEHHQDSLGGSHRRPNRLDWHPRRLPPHTLGATVTEVDLDAEDGDSDEEDKQDGNALVDDEAEEEEMEE